MDYTPLKLRPCYKEYLWGGTKLKELYGKGNGCAITAESWELACRADGMCVVENGDFQGKPLGQVVELHPDYVGINQKGFPLLVKLIDAREDLSVQVHPSDETALLGEQGKAEMWYIVSAKPQSFLYCGLKRAVTREELLSSARDGTICELLNRVPVRRGDVFSIRPGTIHAIGKGLLIAEIQQNSNTTFRIYDYLRKDKDGEPRPLHLERAAEVADLRPVVPRECRANLQVCFPGYRLVQMFSCRYFEAYKLELAGTIRLSCTRASFSHLLVINGRGELRAEDGEWAIESGESWFLPAGLGKYTISGQCTILLSKLNEEERGI